MGMFDSYRKRVSSQGGNMGEALKNQSDVIMNETFTRDIAYRKCYIDGKPVDAKYIVYTYYSVSNTGDNVEYHLEFRPGVHYPLGTYIDIPDDVGEYHRWLIVFRSDEPQFPKYSILKCNWNLKWIKDGVIYECLGVLRSQSSYNSGKQFKCCPHRKLCGKNPSNCWKFVKPYILQRKDEISLNVNVVKAEKNMRMMHGENPKHYLKSIISSEVPNRETFIDYLKRVEISISKRRTPKANKVW